MRDFDYDCMVKKRIASNARRMKNGSKSKKCSLGSDNLTEAQWKKKNGSVNVMNLSKPMTYKEVKALPADLQKEYVNKLLDKFGCTMSFLAKFWNVDVVTVKRLMETLNVDGNRFKRGNRMTAEQVALFNAWANEDTPVRVVQKNECVKVEPITQNKEEFNNIIAEEKPDSQILKAASMAITHFEMMFEGIPNIEQIANTLRCTVVDKPMCIRVIIDEVKSGG